MPHWTNNSPESFHTAIIVDVFDQIDMVRNTQGISYDQLAERLSMDRTQLVMIFSCPANVPLGTLVRITRALDMKIALVAYTDGDVTNEKGPVRSVMFEKAWTHCGQPRSPNQIPPRAES